MASPDACVVGIDVDGRQRYLLETDKLREMLGASLIMQGTVDFAEGLFEQFDVGGLFAPVSGELRAWAPREKRADLLGAAWSLREWLHERGVEHTIAYLEASRRHFEESAGGRAVGSHGEAEPERPSLDWVHRQLGLQMRLRKQAKTPRDGTPRCSLFAPCAIHGLDAANYWFKGVGDYEREPRRRLVGYRARAKFDAWERDRKKFYDGLIFAPVMEKLSRITGIERLDPVLIQRAIVYRDLADAIEDAGNEDTPERVGDQYLAFVCADGDGTGRMLAALDWNTDAWNDGLQPWERNREFARCLDACVHRALGEAIANAVEIDEAAAAALARGEKRTVFVPVLPQLRGGEDVWFLATRAVALELAEGFATRYERHVTASKSPVARALQVASGAPGAQCDRLTISFGVAFAKAGYPAHAMVDAAESLLRSAKDLRRDLRGSGGIGESCIDWHWVQSSLSQGVAEARDAGFLYADIDGAEMRLTSLPWTIDELRAFRDASSRLRAVSRRKRKQLDQILRFGRGLSSLAWDGWKAGLSTGEPEVLADALGRLPPRCGPGADPWVEVAARTSTPSTTTLMTPLLDLVALDDVYS